jgi:hypothetical protein
MKFFCLRCIWSIFGRHRCRHSGIRAHPACLCAHPLLEHKGDCRGKKLNARDAGAARAALTAGAGPVPKSAVMYIYRRGQLLWWQSLALFFFAKAFKTANRLFRS